MAKPLRSAAPFPVAKPSKRSDRAERARHKADLPRNPTQVAASSEKGVIPAKKLGSRAKKPRKSGYS